jgi:hypothetical protein
MSRDRWDVLLFSDPWTGQGEIVLDWVLRGDNPEEFGDL